jgi:formamidopyrimidine-DNA glycosylase
MPELPEVETVTRRIEKLILGKKIEASEIYWKRTIGGISEKRFDKLVNGNKIEKVWRRAKYIFIQLSSGASLVVHLRMSGDLLVKRVSTPIEKHLRVRLILSGGKDLRFIDTRKFGRFVHHQHESEVLNRLGPEPIDSDFDIESFYQKLKKSRRMIKPMLLDQSVLAGLGNIYVIETLWKAKVHPLLPANKLTRKQAELIILSAANVLKKAIAARGTDLGDGVWKTGAFIPKVYGRSGEPCIRCGSKIVKIKVAQRGTDYCSVCQQL